MARAIPPHGMEFGSERRRSRRLSRVQPHAWARSDDVQAATGVSTQTHDGPAETHIAWSVCKRLVSPLRTGETPTQRQGRPKNGGSGTLRRLGVHTPRTTLDHISCPAGRREHPRLVACPRCAATPQQTPARSSLHVAYVSHRGSGSQPASRRPTPRCFSLVLKMGRRARRCQRSRPILLAACLPVVLAPPDTAVLGLAPVPWTGTDLGLKRSAGTRRRVGVIGRRRAGLCLHDGGRVDGSDAEPDVRRTPSHGLKEARDRHAQRAGDLAEVPEGGVAEPHLAAGHIGAGEIRGGRTC